MLGNKDHLSSPVSLRLSTLGEGEEVLEVVNCFFSMPVTSFAVSKIEQVGKIKLFIQQVKEISEIFPGHY